MSQAALDAYLDYGEGYPDCPACGDNSYVYPALATDLDTGEEFRTSTLLSCELCRDPTYFCVDDDGNVSVLTFEPLCSHIKPEGLTSSPLRGPTQWLVYNGPQWFRLYTTSPLRGSTRLLDAHPCPRARGFGRGIMPLVAL